MHKRSEPNLHALSCGDSIFYIIYVSPACVSSVAKLRGWLNKTDAVECVPHWGVCTFSEMRHSRYLYSGKSLMVDWAPLLLCPFRPTCSLFDLIFFKFSLISHLNWSCE